MDKGFSTSNEFMLVYARTSGHNIKNVVIDEKKKKQFNLNDEKGNYYLKDYIMVQGGSRGATRQDKPEYWYPIYVSQDLSKATLEMVEGYEEVFPITNTGREMTWITKPDTFLKRFKNGEVVIKRENEKIVIYRKYREKQIITTHWVDPRYNATSHGTIPLEDLLGRKVEGSYPKSINIVLDILKLTTNPGDIILDFFAGTGTTAHAVLKLNELKEGPRQYILIEQLERQVAVCKERLEKVMTKSNFISCELKSDNQIFLDRIQSATDSDALLDIWREMCKGISVLKWYLNTDNIEEAEKEFIDIDDVEQKKKCLVELIDKSHLYVHYSEMDDENARVNETDKRLNHSFYKGDTNAKS